MASMGDVTQILSKIEYGDPSAAEQLLPLIYDELRALATAKMSDESPDHTLQATALVHEAYIRLVDVDQAKHWNSRGHFFGAAAEAMRRILVDAARRKASEKHGGHLRRHDVDEVEIAEREVMENILQLDDLLAQLATVDAAAAELIKLRYFGGLTAEEGARVLGVSPRTADRLWVFARSWLFTRMQDS
jgi:RNA polymerase sigma factor (TIGR02999 family)